MNKKRQILFIATIAIMAILITNCKKKEECEIHNFGSVKFHSHTECYFNGDYHYVYIYLDGNRVGSISGRGGEYIKKNVSVGIHTYEAKYSVWPVGTSDLIASGSFDVVQCNESQVNF